jgi:hypothetical protein
MVGLAAASGVGANQVGEIQPFHYIDYVARQMVSVIKPNNGMLI